MGHFGPTLRHVKAICQKHGVPYVQENIFARMAKVSTAQYPPRSVPLKILVGYIYIHIYI